VIERPVIIVTGDFGMQLRIDARGLDYAEMPTSTPRTTSADRVPATMEK
jgi:hypothetical protein